MTNTKNKLLITLLKSSLLLFLFGICSNGYGQIVLTPGSTIAGSTSVDYYTYGMCSTNYGTGSDTEERYSYTATADVPCASVTINPETQYTGVFVFEGALPSSAADPCHASAFVNVFGNSDPFTADFSMTDGTTYYFIVTTDFEGDVNFTINLEIPTIPTPFVVMSDASTTITDGEVLNFYDSGGPTCEYKLNEDYTLTVCPDAAGAAADKIVQVEFTDFDRDGNCLTSSELTFYKGSTATSGNEIFSGEYSNLVYTQDVRKFSAITAGGCMTIKWDNGSDTNCEGVGWEGNFQLIDNPCTSTLMADMCVNAPMLILGETLASNSECFTGGSGACGIGSNNNGWFKFTANASVININYEITGGNSCYSADDVGTGVDEVHNDEISDEAGIQFLLYEGCGAAQQICTSVLLGTGGINVETGTFATGTWTEGDGFGEALTEGNVYYAQFSSYGGDLCNFTVTGAAGVSLPIELLSFSARLTNDVPVLDWVTVSEENNAGFEVQRSMDGTHFYKIGWLNGEGDSQEEIRYQFADDEIKSNTKYYYRLRQIDYDGEESFSDIASVETKSQDHVIRVQPNPVANNVNPQVYIHSEEAIDGQVILFDITGKQVLSQLFFTDKGENTVELTTNELTEGSYFIKIALGGNTYYEKLIVR